MKVLILSLFILFTLLQAPPSHADSRFFTFTGKLNAEKKTSCYSGKGQLFISEPSSGTLIYQVDVQPQGSFEFKLKPGKYLVRAITSSGCEGLYALEGQGGESAEHTLTLKPRKDKKNES